MKRKRLHVELEEADSRRNELSVGVSGVVGQGSGPDLFIQANPSTTGALGNSIITGKKNIEPYST